MHIKYFDDNPYFIRDKERGCVQVNRVSAIMKSITSYETHLRINVLDLFLESAKNSTTSTYSLFLFSINT